MRKGNNGTSLRSRTTIFVQAYMEDVDTPAVQVLFNGVLNPDPTVLHIPEFCLLECTNILWKKVRFSGMTTETARQSIQNLSAAPVIIHRAGEYLPRAFEIGFTQQLAIYDSIFIALAEKLNCPLITQDAQQTRAAQAVQVSLKPISDFKP